MGITNQISLETVNFFDSDNNNNHMNDSKDMISSETILADYKEFTHNNSNDRFDEKLIQSDSKDVPKFIDITDNKHSSHNSINSIESHHHHDSLLSDNKESTDNNHSILQSDSKNPSPVRKTSIHQLPTINSNETNELLDNLKNKHKAALKVSYLFQSFRL